MVEFAKALNDMFADFRRTGLPGLSPRKQAGGLFYGFRFGSVFMCDALDPTVHFPSQ